MIGRWLCCVSLLLLLPHGAAFAAEFPDNETVIMAGNISYVSGGIGEDSRERLQAFAAAFNLKLLMAKKSGDYLADIQIVISDVTGKALLQATSEGPIFMANLPDGSYEISATCEGMTQKQRVSVVKGKLGTAHFRWP